MNEDVISAKLDRLSEDNTKIYKKVETLDEAVRGTASTPGILTRVFSHAFQLKFIWGLITVGVGTMVTFLVKHLLEGRP